MSKSFDISDILSVTDGKLVSRRHVDGVQDILSYMCGEDIFTHQLPRAMGECAPHLAKQHPDLAAVKVPEGLHDRESCDAFLDGVAAELGASREVEPLPSSAHEVIHPIEELCDMVGTDRVFVVPAPEADDE